MKGLITFCAASVIILSATNAHAKMLLVQTNIPWNANNPATFMSDYFQIPQSDFANEGLSGYNAIFLQGSFIDTPLFNTQIIPNMGKVHDYVESGGLALIHYASLFLYGDSPTIWPPKVQCIFNSTDNTGNIIEEFKDDPLFENVTDDSLDNWINTSHGYLTYLPDNADVLITNGSDQPIYARYTVGLGQVWITTMTLEWGGGNDPIVLKNEITLANQFVPVPVPAAVLLGMLGLGVAGLKLRKFV